MNEEAHQLALEIFELQISIIEKLNEIKRLDDTVHDMILDSFVDTVEKYPEDFMEVYFEWTQADILRIKAEYLEYIQAAENDES